MPPSSLLETVARDLFEAELRKERAGRGRDPLPSGFPAGGLSPDLSQAYWLLPDLIDMAAEFPDQPVTELAPQIRQRLTELYFVDDMGDTVVRQGDQDLIDTQVEMLVRVIEQVRHFARSHGQWSAEPATPQMFG